MRSSFRSVNILANVLCSAHRDIHGPYSAGSLTMLVAGMALLDPRALVGCSAGRLQ